MASTIGEKVGRSLMISLMWSLVLYLSLAGSVGASSALKKELTQLSRAHDGIVTLDDSNFSKFITTAPRHYHLFVLFTASHSRCVLCQTADPEFYTLAESYQRQINSADGSVSDEPIFFAVVPVEKAEKAVGKTELKSVPIIFHVPPAYGKEDSVEISPKSNHAYDLYRNGVDADFMAIFVQQMTGVNIEIYHSPVGRILVSVLFFAAVAFSAKMAWQKRDLVLYYGRKKTVWMAASFAIFALSISGMVYCVIRNPPAVYYDSHSKQVYLFHPQSRGQLVFEGLIVGFFNICCAAAIVILAEVCPYIKDTQRKQKYTIISMATFVFFWYVYIRCYTKKNSWYRL